jgi:hypothetical protein
VLDNVNEFLSHMVARTHAIMMRRHLVPPAPRELHGMILQPRFISTLFQAQKMIGVQVKERSLAFVGQVAQLKGPDAADVIDTDKMLEGYMDDIGLPPDILVPLAQRQQIRQGRQQQAQAQAQGQAALAATQGAANLGKASTAPDALLSRLVGPMAGANAGGGE